ncbi:MAG TPA: L,D-transpeptidase [Coleofasciculaceae cyanobacterium]
MGFNLPLKTRLMFACFTSAGVLFAAAPPIPSQKLVTPPQPKVAQVSPTVPVLTKAIAAISSRLVVDLSEAKVHSYWGDQLLASYPVAVGQPGWETPTGEFKVIQKQRNPIWQHPITRELIPNGSENPLGDRWIGFWSDGRHQIGFHGTNKEELVGQPISHGCLRMKNKDIRALYEQVSVGTQVVVRK